VAGDVPVQVAILPPGEKCKEPPHPFSKIMFMATLQVFLSGNCHQTCIYVQIFCLVANNTSKHGPIVDFV
jgi:hypothetical protein